MLHKYVKIQREEKAIFVIFHESFIVWQMDFSFVPVMISDIQRHEALGI